MKSADVRETFLKFFENKGHERVRSSSLIPAQDPTLLFTNAGMVQFKDNFLGLKNAGYHRATTSQKCVRAGGKHNDLENVGYTARHHTFFEMLGNFSFGDYFKKEAIALAWELVTIKYGIPKDRLRITVFEKDDESFEIWKAQGVRPDWIYRMGEKDNFWAMGDTGPCGPCTEIHFDWGSKYGTEEGGFGDRFVEIWNLVFMQYNKKTDGTLTPLPKPSVDTGAGLERVSAVLQNVYSNYDTDLFSPLIQDISRLTKVPYGEKNDSDVSLRVIADHLRSTAFLIADGVVPSNEGRGYVLRRILRRAIRHGKKLGLDSPFIYRFVHTLKDQMGTFYPELHTQQTLIEQLIKEEEARFHETLDRGIGLLEDSLLAIQRHHKKILPGDVAFKLYDTFGFPLDLTSVICKERGVSIDETGFNKHMEEQRIKSSSQTSTYGGPVFLSIQVPQLNSKFLGYHTHASKGQAILLFDEQGSKVSKLNKNQKGFIVFDQTSFYAESGGQVGDRGQILSSSVKAIVSDTRKEGTTFLHAVTVTEGTLEENRSYDLQVDEKLRLATAINHTATHLLHAALRQLPEIGPRIKQAGSLVNEHLLRFDFSCPRALTKEELHHLEDILNEEIRRGQEVSSKEMSFDDAMKTGALAFFDEKYGKEVRVLSVGEKGKEFSVELCGGTHLTNTARIGLFTILSESSVASGTRRIIALTAERALHHLRSKRTLLETVSEKLKTNEDQILPKLDALVLEAKKLKKDLEDERIKKAHALAKGGSDNQALWERQTEINGLKIIAEEVSGSDPKVLRSLVDQIRDKLKEKTAVCLASSVPDKAFICVGLTPDLVEKYHAGKLVQQLALEVGGTGGGRADFAQAGGTDISGIPKAMSKFKELMGTTA